METRVDEAPISSSEGPSDPSSEGPPLGDCDHVESPLLKRRRVEERPPPHKAKAEEWIKGLAAVEAFAQQQSPPTVDDMLELVRIWGSEKFVLNAVAKAVNKQLDVAAAADAGVCRGRGGAPSKKTPLRELKLQKDDESESSSDEEDHDQEEFYEEIDEVFEKLEQALDDPGCGLAHGFATNAEIAEVLGPLQSRDPKTVNVEEALHVVAFMANINGVQAGPANSWFEDFADAHETIAEFV